MNIFSILKEYIKNELILLDRAIEDIKRVQADISTNLDALLICQNLLVNDIEQLDVYEMSKVLNFLGQYDNLNDNIIRLNEIKKIHKYLSNPKIPNIGVKKEALTFLEYFNEKLKLMQVEFHKQNSEKNGYIKAYEDRKTKYNKYLNFFNEDSFKEGISKEEINEFFDFLEESKIDKEVVFEIIAHYVISSLKNTHIQKISINQKTEIEEIETVIDENREKILNPINEEKNVSEKTKDALLTKEEQEIIKNIQYLIEMHETEVDDQICELVEALFSDFSIEDRREMYITEKNLDWETIIADYRINLLPNIDKNKEEILDIFRFILEINSKYIAINEDEAKLKNCQIVFDEIYEAVQQIVNEYYGQNYNDIYNASHKKINDIVIELGKLAEETSLKLKKQAIDLKTFEDTNNKLRILINEYKKLSLMKTSENSISIENITPYNLNTTKSIILLLKDKNGYFVPLEEINNTYADGKSNVRERELEKAVAMISSRGMANNKKELKPSIVTYKGQTGRDRPLEELYGFGVYRIRFTEDGRTAYITVPVCEENRKKLTKIYGENIFSNNYNSIILIVASIYSNASHAEYSKLKELIDENCVYVRNIINIFSDPNANIDDLRNIIEDSAKECKKISNNYGRGGK